MRFALALSVIAMGVLTLPSTTTAQSSLAEQQRRCDDLRARVEKARNDLDIQRTRAEGNRERQEIVERAMRARGASEAEIAVSRQRARSVDLMSGSESSARMAYERARENYDLQGCSSGGRSNYNYDIDE